MRGFFSTIACGVATMSCGAMRAAQDADASPPRDARGDGPADAAIDAATREDIGIPSIGPRVVLGFADFEAGPTRPRIEHADARWYGFEGGERARIDEGALRIDYPEGQFSAALGLTLARLGTREVFVQFRARMPAPRGGLKFFKVFGHNPRDNSLTGWNDSVASNYANTTFGLDYTGIDDGKGSFYYVSFGDGSTDENDTSHGIWLDGSNPRGIGRSYPTARVQTPQMRNFRAADWGDGWHTFRMMMRFNSGDSPASEVADGAYFLEIDGAVFARASRVLNRHPSNRPSIDRVELGGWAQTNDAPFSIYFDDVLITTGSF